MTKMNQWLAVAGILFALSLGADRLAAQENNNNNNNNNRDRGQGGGGQGGGRRNFDPAQFQQMMMDRTREQLEVKDDAEWKAIEPLVQKVRDNQMSSFGGMARSFRRQGGDSGQGGGDRGGARGGGGFMGRPNADADLLEKAIESKASSSELKQALAKYAESRKAKQAELEKAQAELRKVLSVRQEAIATLNGLL